MYLFVYNIKDIYTFEFSSFILIIIFSKYKLKFSINYDSNFPKS